MTAEKEEYQMVISKKERKEGKRKNQSSDKNERSRGPDCTPECQASQQGWRTDETIRRLTGIYFYTAGPTTPSDVSRGRGATIPCRKLSKRRSGRDNIAQGTVPNGGERLDEAVDTGVGFWFEINRR